MKTRILIFVTSLALFILTEFDGKGTIVEFKRNYNSILIEPLSYFLLGLWVSILLLFSVKEKYFKTWLRYYLYAYLPVSVLLIVTSGGGSSFIWPSRTDFAILTGIILVTATALFVLGHLVYDWRQKRKGGVKK